MTEHLSRPRSTAEPRRLLLALLLSLLLHALILYFVRYAPPSWSGLSSGSSPLNVILDLAPAKAVKQSEIAQASQDSQGIAKAGVMNHNPFPEQSLTVAKASPAETARTDIPADVIGKEVLTVKKSDQVIPVEAVPDLLATKIPATENPVAEEKQYAPAPEVAKPEIVAPAPVAELVSTVPATGDKPVNIVHAESAQAISPAEMQGSLPVQAPPANTEQPKAVPAEEPKPEPIRISAPVEEEKPAPVELAKPLPVKSDVQQTVAAPVLARPGEPISGQARQPETARAESKAEPGQQSGETGKTDASAAGPTADSLTGLAALSIASVRKLPGDTDRKIRFGERRRTVSLREQDFHYAMYVESVRLKLQRIGQFNYPTAAAMDNLSGTLSVIISIRADGSLEDFSIIQPSSYEVLNKGAENITRLSAPFSPLPDNIRQDTDVLSIKINWSFSGSSQGFE